MTRSRNTNWSMDFILSFRFALHCIFLESTAALYVQHECIFMIIRFLRLVFCFGGFDEYGDICVTRRVNMTRLESCLANFGTRSIWKNNDTLI